MELAGHLQVKEKVDAALAAHKEHLAAPADAFDPPAPEHPKACGISAEELRQKKADLGDPPPDDLRPQAGGDRFDFRQLGH
jgi:hypothetical protein